MNKNLLLFILLLTFSFTQNLKAQTVGDYRTKANGDWSDAATWEVFDGLAWIPAIMGPNSLENVITVRDSVVVSTAESADQVVVRSNGVLNILAGVTFTLLNGDGTDLQCNGRLIVGIGASLGTNGGDLSTMNYTSSAEFEIDGGVNPIVTFNGTDAQAVNGGGSGYFGQPITLDNTNNLVVNGTVGFAGVNFVNGKVWAPGAFVLGQFSGSNFTGQSATRFIDGNVVCIVFDQTPAIFKLPMGQGDSYLPLVFKITLAQGQPQSGFTVSIKGGPAPTLALPSGLTNVSGVRYYNITNTNNTLIDSASLQLSYDTTDNVTDPGHLRIARNYKDSAWINLGGVGSAQKEGDITTTKNFKFLGEFALANAKNGSNTLPLHITSFTAAVAKQAVLLRWATAYEVNTDHFNVERQVQNNPVWQTIGAVAAKAGSSENSYNFNDATVETLGNYLYRINAIDKDGSSILSKTLLVRLQGGPGKMEVTGMFPNPTRDVVHYSVSAAVDDALTVTITGLNGKVAKSQKTIANQPQQVSISELGAGTYFLTITNERTKEKIVKKVVKL